MIREEIRKILNIKKCLCLLGFGILYYLLLLKPYVYSYDGSYRMAVDIAGSITEKFGDSISEEEYEQMKQEAPVEIQTRIDRFIAQNELFKNYEIHTFREFTIAEETLPREESTELWMELYDSIPEEEVSSESIAYIKKDLYNMYLDSYHKEAMGNLDTTSYYENLDKKQKARVAERNQEEVKGIVPQMVVSTNFEVLQYGSCFAIISILFLILPYMVRENKNGMTMLQYSCKKGRKYYVYKLFACLLSSALVLAVEFLLYLVIAKMNCVTDFWNMPAASFSSGYIGWFPLTLGEMTLMNLLLCTMIAVGVGLLVFGVTRYCRNYITAIAWTLPLVVLAGCYGVLIASHFMEITRPKYLVAAVAFAILAAGILTVGGQFLLERKRNID